MSCKKMLYFAALLAAVLGLRSDRLQQEIV